jgi:predicted DNA-binding transcriptional regulator YafY
MRIAFWMCQGGGCEEVESAVDVCDGGQIADPLSVALEKAWSTASTREDELTGIFQAFGSRHAGSQGRFQALAADLWYLFGDEARSEKVRVGDFGPLATGVGDLESKIRLAAQEGRALAKVITTSNEQSDALAHTFASVAKTMQAFGDALAGSGLDEVAEGPPDGLIEDYVGEATAAIDRGRAFGFWYTNHRGVRAWRWVLPQGFWTGTNEFYPDVSRGLFFDAFDLDRNASRTFLADRIEGPFVTAEPDSLPAGPDVDEQEKIQALQRDGHSHSCAVRQVAVGESAVICEQCVGRRPAYEDTLDRVLYGVLSSEDRKNMADAISFGGRPVVDPGHMDLSVQGEPMSKLQKEIVTHMEEVMRATYDAPSELMGGPVSPTATLPGETSAAIGPTRRLSVLEDGTWCAFVVADGAHIPHTRTVGDTPVSAILGKFESGSEPADTEAPGFVPDGGLVGDGWEESTPIEVGQVWIAKDPDALGQRWSKVVVRQGPNEGGLYGVVPHDEPEYLPSFVTAESLRASMRRQVPFIAPEAPPVNIVGPAPGSLWTAEVVDGWKPATRPPAPEPTGPYAEHLAILAGTTSPGEVQALAVLSVDPSAVPAVPVASDTDADTATDPTDPGGW